MSDSIKRRLEEAVRTEPAVGDPYSRFLRRRRSARALRTLSGFVLAGVTLFGFVSIFPGGTGGTPDSGFIPNDPVQPGLQPLKSFEASELGVRLFIPEDWQTMAFDDSARVGPSLADGSSVENLEIRFGELGECGREDCTPLTDLVEDPQAANSAGLRMSKVNVRVGSVRVEAMEVTFPATGAAAIAPRCAGCVGIYAELGSDRVPMLVIAESPSVMESSASMLAEILQTISVSRI